MDEVLKQSFVNNHDGANYSIHRSTEKESTSLINTVQRKLRGGCDQQK